MLHKTGTLRFDIDKRTFIQKIIFASYISLWYIVKLIIPVNLSISYPVPHLNNLPFIFYISPFILSGLIAIVYFYLRQNKAIIFGLLFYFISIVLVLQFITVGYAIMADRYSYLAYTGLLFIVAHYVNIIWYKKSFYRYFIIIILGILILIYGNQTYARTKVWQNSETLWTDAINKNSNTCDIGYYNRGVYYQDIEKNYEKALADYNKAIEINPNYYFAYSNRVSVYMNQKKYNLALIDLHKVIDFDSSFAKAYNNRGLIYFYQNKYAFAMADFNKVIKLDSNYASAYISRGLIYLNQNKYAFALADFNKVIELDSNYAPAYNNRGLVYEKTGHPDLALEEYTKTLKLDPNNELAYFNRGILFFNSRQYEKAKADFNKAEKLNPSNSNAYANMGLTYLAGQQYNSALIEFTKAITLDSTISGYWIKRSEAEYFLNKKEEATRDALKAQQLGFQVDAGYLKELEKK